jgi:hypothetical protein
MTLLAAVSDQSLACALEVAARREANLPGMGRVLAKAPAVEVAATGGARLATGASVSLGEPRIHTHKRFFGTIAMALDQEMRGRDGPTGVKRARQPHKSPVHPLKR